MLEHSKDMHRLKHVSYLSLKLIAHKW